MGPKTFSNFIKFIQGHIGNLNSRVSVLKKQVSILTTRLEGGGPNAEQAPGELVVTQEKLCKTQTAIKELKEFFLKVKKQWTKPKDRVIGHVIWAPPIRVSTHPHGILKVIIGWSLRRNKIDT